jgi:hypothetical protein
VCTTLGRVAQTAAGGGREQLRPPSSRSRAGPAAGTRSRTAVRLGSVIASPTWAVTKADSCGSGIRSASQISPTFGGRDRPRGRILRGRNGAFWYGRRKWLGATPFLARCRPCLAPARRPKSSKSAALSSINPPGAAPLPPGQRSRSAIRRRNSPRMRLAGANRSPRRRPASCPAGGGGGSRGRAIPGGPGGGRRSGLAGEPDQGGGAGAAGRREGRPVGCSPAGGAGGACDLDSRRAAGAGVAGVPPGEVNAQGRQSPPPPETGEESPARPALRLHNYMDYCSFITYTLR